MEFKLDTTKRYHFENISFTQFYGLMNHLNILATTKDIHKVLAYSEDHGWDLWDKMGMTCTDAKEIFVGERLLALKKYVKKQMTILEPDVELPLDTNTTYFLGHLSNINITYLINKMGITLPQDITPRQVRYITYDTKDDGRWYPSTDNNLDIHPCIDANIFFGGHIIREETIKEKLSRLENEIKYLYETIDKL